MNWLKIAVFVSFFGIVFVCLAYLADFPLRQSMVLALMLAWLFWALDNRASIPARRFSPYYVRIFPCWPRILTDFKVISKPEEWHEIQRSFKSQPPTEYNVLRSGICFTVTHQTEDFERTLIYADNHHAFATEVDFTEDMTPIRVGRPSKFELEFGDWRKSNISFFMKFGGDGYDLGIEVPSSWWDEVKNSCPKPVREDEDHLTGQVRLILAAIPYREFDLYREPSKWSSSHYEKTAKEIRTRRNEARTNLGWKTIEHDSDLGSELGIDWPESIEHRYFTVEHRAI